MSNGQKKRYENDPDIGKKISERQKKYYADHPDERKKLINIGLKAASDPLINKKISESRKKNWEDPIYRENTITKSKSALSTPKVKKKMSDAQKERFKNPDERNRLIELGRKLANDPILKRKISATRQGIPLEEWERFITPLYLKIRNSLEYYNWRLAVFQRDNFCDCFSGIKGNGNLNAHHIIPFTQLLTENKIKSFEQAISCKELWDINNGVTMLKTTHVAYHSRRGS